MVFPFKSKNPAVKPKSTTSRLAPASHVASIMHGTRTVLMDVKRGRYWGLDDVGSRIWSLLQDHNTIDDIVNRLSCEYEAPADRLQDDVRKFVSTMLQLKLLRAS